MNPPMAYLIFDRRRGGWVHSFNDEHAVVSTTADPTQAKRFPLVGAARDWITDHGDCGYGFRKAYAEIWSEDAKDLVSVWAPDAEFDAGYNAYACNITCPKEATPAFQQGWMRAAEEGTAYSGDDPDADLHLPEDRPEGT